MISVTQFYDWIYKSVQVLAFAALAISTGYSQDGTALRSDSIYKLYRTTKADTDSNAKRLALDVASRLLAGTHVDLTALTATESSDSLTGKSVTIRKDPYLLTYYSGGLLRFSNRDKSYKLMPQDYRLSEAESQKIAWRCIREILIPTKMIVLGANERIVFEGCEYLQSQAVDSMSGKFTGVQKHAAILVFQREIDGIKVGGIGSKVRVQISPDGEVVNLSCAWRPIVGNDKVSRAEMDKMVESFKRSYPGREVLLGYLDPSLLSSGDITLKIFVSPDPQTGKSWQRFDPVYKP